MTIHACEVNGLNQPEVGGPPTVKLRIVLGLLAPRHDHFSFFKRKQHYASLMNNSIPCIIFSYTLGGYSPVDE